MRCIKNLVGKKNDVCKEPKGVPKIVLISEDITQQNHVILFLAK